MKNVFEPCSIGNLTLKNRIVRAATHEGMAHSDGMPTNELLQTYQKLAAGGAGAIITGMSASNKTAGLSRTCACLITTSISLSTKPSTIS